MATIAERIPSPEFVEFDAGLASGLDLMGLRLPVQVLGNSLLNGLTTVTPTVRYLSFRTWLIDRYMHADPPPPDSWKDFLRYAKHAEAIFALANLVHDRQTGGLIGPVKGARKLDTEKSPFQVTPLTQQPAANIYARPSDQLRLTRQNEDGGVPTLGSDYGVPLAAAAEANFSRTRVGHRLRTGQPLDSVTMAELKEFGPVAWAGDLPENERQALLEAVLPSSPELDDLPRLSTYTALLALAERLPESSEGLSEDDLFDEALSPRRRTPAELRNVLDGWLRYAVRDMLAVTAEAGLDAVLGAIEEIDPDGLGIADYTLVRHLLESSAGEQISALRELDLVGSRDQVDTLRFRTLAARVERATETRGEPRDGMRRWNGHLNEKLIWEAVPGLVGGVIIGGLISWLIAERRAGLAVRAGMDHVRLLSHQGNSRFGLEQVILPRLEEWQARDLTVAGVMEEYTHLLIDQHLRIVWARLADDPEKDVSVILRDGERLIRRSGFEAGRTASRIDQAIWWLEQLRLLEDGRITREGRRVLKRCLETIAAHAS